MKRKGEVEMREVTRKVGQAEGKEGDFSCRPDPSLTKAGPTPVNWKEEVLSRCEGKEVVLCVHVSK